MENDAEKKIDEILYGIGVNTFNRFQTFLRMFHKLRGKDYWYALRTSYDSSDNLFHYAAIVKSAFLRNEPEREFLMDDDEREYLQMLPERITIYRGMTEDELQGGSFGVSWTLKRKVAEFFAYKYERNHATNHLKKTVHEITINKKEAIAFMNARQEFEIIYINDAETFLKPRRGSYQ